MKTVITLRVSKKEIRKLPSVEVYGEAVIAMRILNLRAEQYLLKHPNLAITSRTMVHDEPIETATGYMNQMIIQ